MTELVAKRAILFAVQLGRQFDGTWQSDASMSAFVKGSEHGKIDDALVTMGLVAEEVYLKLPEETRDELGSDFTTFLIGKFEFAVGQDPKLNDTQEAIAAWFVDEFELDAPTSSFGA